MVALLATLILSTTAGRVSASSPATPAMTMTPTTLFATAPLFADWSVTDGLKKFVDGVAAQPVLFLVLLVGIVATILWSRNENNASGTLGRSPWVILVIGIIIGVMLCKAFQGDLGGPGAPPGAADEAQTYVEFDASKNKIKLKSSPTVPSGYRIVVAQDDKGKGRQFVTAGESDTGAGEVWVYLDPIAPSATVTAKGLKKLR